MNKDTKKWIGVVMMLPLIAMVFITILSFVIMFMSILIIEGCWVELSIGLIVALFFIGLYIIGNEW